MRLSSKATTSAILFLLLVLVFSAEPGSAREVRLPLTVEAPMIREALMQKLFNDPQKRAVFWGEPGSCSFFHLEDPKVESGIDRLRVVAHGEAKIGTDFGTGCLSPIAWSGFLELFERPRLDGWRLRFEVVDSNLYDEQHEKAALVGQLWDRIKESVQPRFAAVSVDLGEPFRELRDFLPTVMSGPGAEEARRAIDTIRPVDARALPKGIVVEAAIEVPERAASPAALAPEPPLTDAEIEAFTARANQWDAFFTFVVKTLGAKTLSKTARQALLETLIDARYQVTATLAEPARREDPVRQLFVKSWERLRPAADEISRELPGAEAAQVLTFVAAGDALTALDQLGPSFGVEVSADGLRRMARMIAPTASGDPLEYDPGVDPVLRRLLGFGEPAPEPSAPLEPSGGWWPWRWLGPGRAFAESAAQDRSHDTQGWVVEDAGDVGAYLGRVREVLSRVASDVVAREKLAGADADLVRKLITATAWQESCWRQFVKKNGAVTYLRSNRGSVGILQVNERVWRGFYERDKLRWRIAYNAQAGSEVLLRYLEIVDDPPPGARKPSSAGDRARAVYAAYNGGPDQLRRHLDPGRRGKALAHVIDDLFGEKFDSLGAGSVETKVASCLVGGPA